MQLIYAAGAFFQVVIAVATIAATAAAVIGFWRGRKERRHPWR